MPDKANENKKIGARLALARKAVGLTQTAMAKEIGVSHRAYHSYEKGQRGLPVETLVAIADRFDVDAAWILLGTKAVRAAHDFDALERIVTSLDKHINEEKIKIKSEKRGTILACWYQFLVEGSEITDDDVRTWIKLAKD